MAQPPGALWPRSSRQPTQRGQPLDAASRSTRPAARRGQLFDGRAPKALAGDGTSPRDALVAPALHARVSGWELAAGVSSESRPHAGQ